MVRDLMGLVAVGPFLPFSPSPLGSTPRSTSPSPLASDCPPASVAPRPSTTSPRHPLGVSPWVLGPRTSASLVSGS